ncbi:MAG: ABC transporter permease [Aeromicrobium sp.]
MSTTATPVTIDTTRPGIPFGRLVKVELRKMFNTRSGFWLMMSIAIIAIIAAICVIAFVPNEDLSYGLFSAAFGVPMGVLLPVVAILSVTSEWSQRTGLITFTLAPHRASVIGAKAAASVIVAVVSVAFALATGAVGNVVGAAINGIDADWDVAFSDMLYLLLGQVLGLLIGFMLGVLIRNSAGAIVGYFVYSFVIPTILGILAELQDWFKDLQPWVDFNTASAQLFDGSLTGEEWAQLGVSSIPWLILPLGLGVWAVLRSEVK